MIHTLMRLVRKLFQWIRQFLQHFQRTGPTITLDTGKRVVVGRKIAEGGFSFVFEATAAIDDSQRGHDPVDKKFALKRIHCPDAELLQACRDEAAVHRSVSHPNLMPLLGLAIHQSDCYMLFPHCSQSLRDVVNRRNPLITGDKTVAAVQEAPWSEVTALNIFLRICAGVLALHEEGGYSHRDIKLENVLLIQQQPVLMDFGSAGPLQVTLNSRRDVLAVADRAAQHTTMPYRPPELFEGGVRVHDTLDYRAVDVWSLGCTLHALLYGASPFECEFNARHGIRIVDCTHLSVLGNIPTPKPPLSLWYSNDIRTLLLEPMLRQDRHQRMSLAEAIAVTERLIVQFGGRVDRGEQYSAGGGDDDDDDGEQDGISLMSKVV